MADGEENSWADYREQFEHLMLYDGVQAVYVMKHKPILRVETNGSLALSDAVEIIESVGLSGRVVGGQGYRPSLDFDLPDSDSPT